MYRFSIRGLIGLTSLIAVIVAIGYHAESEVERDIRKLGKIPIEDPEALFAKVEVLAEAGDHAQSWTSEPFEKAIPKLTRTELAQAANHYREQYPLVSLRSRLKYEKSARPRRAQLQPETNERLDLAEDPTMGGMTKGRLPPTRSNALYQLHSDWVFTFITQEGVGVSRMRFPSVWDLKLNDLPEVPFAVQSHDTPAQGRLLDVVDDEPDNQEFSRRISHMNSEWHEERAQMAFESWSESNNPFYLPTRPRLEWYHEQDRLEFGESGRNGYAKDVDHVAGFLPHRLTEKRKLRMDLMPHSYGYHEPTSPQHTWLLKSLQLVSLLKYDRPYVYVSTSLPDMGSLSNASVRELDEFERQGLDELYAGEDLNIRGRENQVRMLGSLRAIKQCMDCHSVKRGQLLGAFSYEFVRSSALPSRWTGTTLAANQSD